MMSAKAFAAQSATSPLAPFAIQRRDPAAHDVQIQILYCGVCHTDVHIARNEWKGTTYPCVPGHEIIGRVTKVGAHVTKFKVGDPSASVAWSTPAAPARIAGKASNNFAKAGPTFTYNSPDKVLGGMTLRRLLPERGGGRGVCPARPQKPGLGAAAPLLCAGITTYSPLRHHKVGPGKKVGVVGLGAWATWASNWPKLSARTSSSSPPRPAKPRTPYGWAQMWSLIPETRPR